MKCELSQCWDCPALLECRERSCRKERHQSVLSQRMNSQSFPCQTLGLPQSTIVDCGTSKRQSKPPCALTARCDCTSATVRTRNAFERKANKATTQHTQRDDDCHPVTLSPHHHDPSKSGWRLTELRATHLTTTTIFIHPTQAHAVERMERLKQFNNPINCCSM